MKQCYKFLFVIVCISSCCISHAQSGLIKGRVVDSSTKGVVEYAYILNYSLSKQIYSNSKGEFKLVAQKGDTLVMYAAGYFYQKIIVNESMLGSEAVSFSLNPQPYELEEARIPVFGTYDEFKRKFVSFDREATETERVNQYMADVSRSAAVEAYEQAKAAQHMDGVTFVGVPILTPEEIERKKLAVIIQKEQIRDQIYQKFNPHVVKKITGLSNDDEIIEFMLFCKFTDEYLLEVNEYDLSTRIALKFELFRKMKQDEKLMENPLNRAEMLNHSFA
jgi:hypothetical protein